MATGYGNTYKAVVLDNVDPMSQNRLNVTVPDVDIQAAWANPLMASHYESIPTVGDEVSVVFERSDSEMPVWMTSTVAQGFANVGGYGVYRGTVVNTTDPAQENRLQLTIPDTSGSEPVWATPSSSVGAEVPTVGSDVWVQFQSGDTSRPVWVGLT